MDELIQTIRAVTGREVIWILYRKGEMRSPLALLSDFEMQRLIRSVEEQSEQAKG